jgi:anti-sigma B factor antagonist
MASAHQMTVSVVPGQERIAIVPVGELDVASVGDVQREAGELLDAGFTDVVIDLRRLTFIDSTGVGLLLNLRAEAVRRDRTLTFIPGCPVVQRVFELTGTLDLLRWET